MVKIIATTKSNTKQAARHTQPALADHPRFGQHVVRQTAGSRHGAAVMNWMYRNPNHPVARRLWGAEGDIDRNEMSEISSFVRRNAPKWAEQMDPSEGRFMEQMVGQRMQEGSIPRNFLQAMYHAGGRDQRGERRTVTGMRAPQHVDIDPFYSGDIEDRPELERKGMWEQLAAGDMGGFISSLAGRFMPQLTGMQQPHMTAGIQGTQQPSQPRDL